MAEPALLTPERMINNLDALSSGVHDPITLLSNAAALLYHSLPDVNWAGFYRLVGDTLRLYPFSGLPACAAIPLGKGVCGTAAKAQTTVRVADVHRFPGHIACDAASRSEIVVPLIVGGAVWGVMDLDSPAVGRFTQKDQALLEAFAQRLASWL